MSTKTYQQRFEEPERVSAYDKAYAVGGYYASMWNLEREWLIHQIDTIFEPTKNSNCLDFACGSGRVTTVLESRYKDCYGVDLSDAMLALAAERCESSVLKKLDIFDNDEITRMKFDLVTAYRFFLHTEPDLRVKFLKRLTSLLKPDGGRLIFNVHGNKWSLRKLSTAVRGGSWLKKVDNEMSLSEIRELIHEAGLEIESWKGFGFLPAIIYRTPLRGIGMTVDKLCTKLSFMSGVSINLAFVCRKIGANSEG